MKLAYVDSSCLVAVAFGEGNAAGLRRRLKGFDRLLSSNLLEAEVRAALRREGLRASTERDAGKGQGAAAGKALGPAAGEGWDDLLTWVDWVMPSRPLSEEIRTVLGAGYLRGADLWHLATALYVAPDPSELPFLTLDEGQGEVARALGFPE